MKKRNFLTAAVAVATLSASTAFAAAHKDMEKCKIVDADGKGLIKEHKADCASKNNSCSGSNGPGDPEAWILVPKGECKKINDGDFSGVSDAIKAKVEGAK